MQHVIVVGMGMSRRDITVAQLEVIRSADILMGARRHLDQFEDLDMDKQAITGNVDEIITAIHTRLATHRIVVLASGDPLLFGIGARITKALGQDRVTILPNISSIAAAFARIKEPWDEAKVISLHGRDRKYHLLEALKKGAPVAVLTDSNQTPRWLAHWLLENGVDDWRMAVFEKLGAPEESFDWYSLSQAVGKTFGQPNVVILIRSSKEINRNQKGLHLGMADDAFEHENGLITKFEVRAVCLAKLCLMPGLTLWDLGAGSGSVGIEAAALLHTGRIVAVERKRERVEQIRRNSRRYGLYNHQTVQATLPEGMAGLPRPDRIFIGGGGRDLAAMIQAAADRLTPEGIIVANTVLLDNLTAAIDAMETKGMNTQVVQLQVGESKAMPWSRRMAAQNPVWIVTGVLGP